MRPEKITLLERTLGESIEEKIVGSVEKPKLTISDQEYQRMVAQQLRKLRRTTKDQDQNISEIDLEVMASSIVSKYVTNYCDKTLLVKEGEKRTYAHHNGLLKKIRQNELKDYYKRKRQVPRLSFSQLGKQQQQKVERVSGDEHADLSILRNELRKGKAIVAILLNFKGYKLHCWEFICSGMPSDKMFAKQFVAYVHQKTGNSITEKYANDLKNNVLKEVRELAERILHQ